MGDKEVKDMSYKVLKLNKWKYKYMTEGDKPRNLELENTKCKRVKVLDSGNNE